jgi:hypothetical protein
MSVETLPPDPSLYEAIEVAVRELVSHKHVDGRSYVNAPIFYPDGSFVTVRIDRVKNGIRVSDCGAGYRQIEAVGSELSFTRTADTIAESVGLERSRRSFYCDVAPSDLARAIGDVSAASWTLVDRVYGQLSDADEVAIEDHLRERLNIVFGAGRVDQEIKIKGQSTNEWKVSAIVNLEAGRAIFHAVSNHAQSVYRTSAAFHDLEALEYPPKLISVVRSKADLGPRLSLLAQAGRVLEEGASNEEFLRAVA